MSNPWDGDPIVQAAAPPTAGAMPWERDPIVLEAGNTGDARPLTIRPHGGATASWGDEPPSTALDVGKGILSGLVRGAEATVTAPVTMTRDAARGAVHWGDTGVRKALGIPQLTTPEIASRDADERAIDAISPIPNPADLAERADVATRAATYEPQTGYGRSAENIASFLPAATLGPGGLVRKTLAYGVLPGVTSEAAGRLASPLGPKAETAARIAGGLGGAGLGHMLVAPTPAAAILSGATRGVTDADMGDAAELVARARTQGIALTPAEAVQHVTNGASGLGDVVRNLEGMHESAPVMGSFFRQRPDQVRQAATNLFRDIAPFSTEPSQTAVAAQREAQGALGQIRQDRTAAAGRYYADSVGDQVPHDRMADVAARLDALRGENPNNPELTAPLADLRRQIVATPADPGMPAFPGQRTPVTDPRTGAIIRYHQAPGLAPVPARPETYITDVGQLDKIYGALRDQYTGAPPLGQTGTQARAGRIAAQGLGYLDQELRAASPDLAAGRTAYGIMSDRWVRPREIGPVGQISESDDLGAMGRSLYPNNPNVGSQFETSEAVSRLPATAGAITRNHLQTGFNEATQRLQPGPNQFGGAKFAAQTFGNPQQAANIVEGVGALPNGTTLGPRLDDLVESLRATGTRQPIGSKTAYNQQFREGLEAGSPIGNAASLAFSPGKLPGIVKDAYQRHRIGINAEELARLVTAPDAMEALGAARAAIPPERYRATILAEVLRRLAATVPAAEQADQGRPVSVLLPRPMRSVLAPPYP